MSSFIALQDGIAMTKTYRTKRDALINAGTIPDDFLPLCETFEKTQVMALLNKTGCEGLRTYWGLKEGKVSLVLVGVNAQDEDMIPGDGQSAAAEEDDDLLDRGVRCPTSCPPPSGLNE